MARTNPCQRCGEVPAAEFMLSAHWPEASWFAFEDGTPMIAMNICEDCLINAAYQRTQQLADAQRHEGALEQIEQTEDLEPVSAPPEPPRASKRGKPEKPEEPEITETPAPVTAD